MRAKDVLQFHWIKRKLHFYFNLLGFLNKQAIAKATADNVYGFSE